MKPYPNLRGEMENDFTQANYRRIIQLVKESGRPPVSYEAIPWGKTYLLWRHDIDFSVNRGVKLAKINAEYSVHSTFFVNLHSTFYNPFELDQAQLLRTIVSMGHDIGVHFDVSFYGELDSVEYEVHIAKEADLLAELVGKRPVAVSFHNPTKGLPKINTLKLGGLVNAYSQELMTDSRYCSDSNGYWRHARLVDLVANTTIERLHVLTHPGWWVEKPMAPRMRILRAVQGRSAAVMDDYDRLLENHGRENIGA